MWLLSYTFNIIIFHVMKKSYLIFLILFSVLLWWCNLWKTNEWKWHNINKQSEVHKGWIVKKDINHKESNVNHKDIKNSNVNQIESKKNNKNLWYWNDYNGKLLYLEKSWIHLLSGWLYLLKDVAILNEKMYKSLQEFQNLGSWLNNVEKNALQETLKNYQKNLELQKEFMTSLMDRQNCLKNMSSKPKQEITRPKQEITRPKQRSNGF